MLTSLDQMLIYELDRFASLLQSNPQMQIEIIGHTSQLPLEAENDRLSLQSS